MDKIIGALAFKSGIYADARKDADFTPTAWMIVIFSAFLSALGSNTLMLRTGRSGSWLLGVFGTTLFMGLGFPLACAAIQWSSKYFFDRHAEFEGLLRSFGLARVWMAITVVGILTVISPTLACGTGIIGLIAILLWFFAWGMAIKEVYGLDWLRSFTLAIIGMFVLVAIAIISNTVLSLFGLMSTSIFRVLG